jgi:hypothetical protein
MSLECVNERIADSNSVRAARLLLLRELNAERVLLVEPTQPLIAYMLLFAETPALLIRRRVSELYMRAKRHAAETGFIYVFRDTRDGDVSIVKIGSTVALHRRIAEWRTALGASKDELSLLFSVKSSDVRLAELVLHALLFCQWMPKRVRADTGAALLEYFRVENLDALELLLEAVARHTSWHEERRRMRSRAFE